MTTNIQTRWIRTCQECGKEQVTNRPNLNDNLEKWRDKKCKFCRSIALDYGGPRQLLRLSGNEIVIQYTNDEHQEIDM